MRFVLASTLAATLLLASGCEMLMPKEKGFFNLKNGTDATLDILVSDNEQCVIGLHSSVATNTWRNYDIEEKGGSAFLCVNRRPCAVTYGKRYVDEDGAVTETEAPQY